MLGGTVKAEDIVKGLAFKLKGGSEYVAICDFSSFLDFTCGDFVLLHLNNYRFRAKPLSANTWSHEMSSKILFSRIQPWERLQLARSLQAEGLKPNEIKRNIFCQESL